MTEFSDLKSFVDSWEDRFVEVTEFDVFKNSPKGNIIVTELLPVVIRQFLLNIIVILNGQLKRELEI